MSPASTHRYHDSLAPRLRDRLGAALRPGWTRSLLVRRVVAAALVIAAVVVGMTGTRADGDVEVVVAAHELRPGQVVDVADLQSRRIAGATVPGGALTHAGPAIGKTVTGRVRSGEIMTDTRLLSSRLPADLTGDDDARLVPIRLSDEAVTALLRPGDVVDVLTDEAEVLARRAVVALHAAETQSGGIAPGGTAAAPVLLAMDATSAHRVAAAGLDTALAVVMH
ncbi:MULTISPECIES: SAF domain-containing protein [unclassified Gordonia (in: high G+C Gram-positive bacteria)]|uniref:SAF domain-containing protein n=1 Tax=Gordonia TaxID=2053 RepID=UPI00071DC589|nr:MULTISPECIES: SAF domain-containing protein [unclassified Gordonia (in: high G+C Gram-positive bacteria)]KSU58458.1 flagellar biosynthesis protein FlgA [Gordonia sp. SGD-V-85]MDT0221314.1 SAF domain-containing protein [Gordonia sp. AC31]SCC20644.1 Chaperone for flagella basal body P-ring formation [Gordonia sp. v-85]